MSYLRGEVIMTAIAPLRERLGAVPASEVKTAEFLNFMVFGDPGTGKTTLLSTAQDHEETSPYLHIDIEGGTAVFKHRADIDVVSVRSMSELVKLQQDLYNE